LYEPGFLSVCVCACVRACVREREDVCVKLCVCVCVLYRCTHDVFFSAAGCNVFARVYYRIHFVAILTQGNRLSVGGCLALKTQRPRSKFHGSFAIVPSVSIAFASSLFPPHRWVGRYVPQRGPLLLQRGRAPVRVGTEPWETLKIYHSEDWIALSFAILYLSSHRQVISRNWSQ
jgi:hypothetical protein